MRVRSGWRREKDEGLSCSPDLQVEHSLTLQLVGIDSSQIVFQIDRTPATLSGS